MKEKETVNSWVFPKKPHVKDVNPAEAWPWPLQEKPAMKSIPVWPPAKTIGEKLADAIVEGVQNTHDAVNHPKHYTSHPSGVECITITEHYNFCVGNAIKYLWRNGLKDDEGSSSVKDLKKAVWYINREIENLEKNNASS